MFKQLNKKGYKHYYDGTIEELDSMNKDNQHLYSEIMQIIMWLYEKHGIWIVVNFANKTQWYFDCNKIGFDGKDKKLFQSNYNYNSPTEAYEAAIEYCLNKLI